MTTISVVIPTFNRAASLERTLESLSASEGDIEFDVVVVDDGSTDTTTSMLAAIEVDYPLTVVRQANMGPSAARNRGVEAATGELIVFTDDDCVADPRLLQAHRVAHENGNEHKRVVLGPMRAAALPTLSPWTAWEQRRIERTFDVLSTGEAHPTWRNLYTGNASIRRCELLRTGGFDTEHRRGEDIELGLRLDRAGFEFVFSPEARVTHHPHRSLDAWERGAESYGALAVLLRAQEGRPVRDLRDADHFDERHRAVQALALLTAHHPRRRGIVVGALRTVTRLSARVGLDFVTQPALSLLFNTVFFGALATAMSDPELEVAS